MAVQESRLIISIDARNAERIARALNLELRGITNNGNRATSQTNALGTSMQALAGYMGGVVTVGAAISKMDAYTGLQNRLKLVTDSQAELNTAMNDTFAIAQKTASSWDSTAMVYQRFADNADRLGISMKQTAALTETVSKAISVSGGSAASAEAALMQFGQALASGVLRGEEFNSIAEQAPGLLKAIAFGLDTNVGSLRAMAAEGKITGDVLVEALSKAQPYIDDLFNKTDFTIAQSFTRLSNEITKFVGEAGAGSGAAAGLSAAISGLANNLSTIADIAIVGGVALLTKTILTQTVAIYGSITASVARRSALLAELAAQAAASTAEVARTGAIAQLTAMQLVDAKATAARMTGIQRLAYVQATVIPLEAKATQALAVHTATTAADTAVQNANNAARSRGAMLLGLVGGPIGAITIGVAALAAGYMYLKSRTDEANAKLEEQGKIAQETDAELRKLSGNDKISAVNDLTAAFNAQNETLAKSKESVDAVLFSIRAVSVENEAARKVTEDARNGVISYDEAIKRLNQMDIPTDLYDQLKKQVFQYNENAEKAGESQRALSALGKVVKLAGNLFQNAAVQVAKNTDELNKNETAAQKAAKAQAEFKKSLQQKLYDQVFLNTVTQKYGKSLQEAQLLLEAQKKTKGQISVEDKKLISNIVTQTQSAEAYAKSLTAGAKASKKAQSEAAKEAKQQAKEAERLQEEQYQLREQIAYEYADRIGKIEKDLAREIADIQKANFATPEQTRGFIQNAQNRADLEKQLYIAQLTQQYSEWRATEEQKLDYKVHVNELMIQLDSDMNDDLKRQAMQSLKDQANYELAQIQLAKETRMFQMKEAFLSETDAMNQRYALEEKRIMQINDVEEREFALKMNRLKQEEEQRKRIQSAQMNMGNIQAQNNGTSGFVNIETTRFDQIGVSEELFLAQLAVNFENREQLWREHEDRVTEINRAADAARLDLQFNYGQQITGSFADIFKNIAGEQSNGYKLMFTAQKAFAIAQSAMAIQQGIAQAFALPFPLNLVAAATVAAQTASIVSNIKAIRAEGFKSGGYTGNGGTSEVAGVVHGQEYVLNAEATKRVGRGTLDALNNGGTLESGSGVNVIINVPQGYKAVQTQSENGVTIDIVENMINQSWGNVNRPNSNESRAIQGAFGIAPKR